MQRDEEEKKRQLQYVKEQEEENNDASEEEQDPPPKVLNAFEMLNAGDSGERTEPEDDESEELPSSAKAEQVVAPVSSASKQKKSKKKRKNKKATPLANTSSAADTQLDEIDLALKSLSTDSKGKPSAVAETTPLIDPAHIQLHRLLAVESKHLNALSEMKRLFGNVVLENEDENPSTPRRRGRGPQQIDLGSALTARNSPVSRGQGMTGLSLRRNFLMQGKEEWPKAAGVGLGMELVEKLDDGTIEYRFIHNKPYQDLQRQFMSCVESMDPQRMISMLIYNPYHVSTLLQVSEIAKQQGDHSVSGDLLERALFTFGRSLHSSFTGALAEGKARLNFDRPENREFWLAAWRYMNNLGQRGTWRTAYEWAKLIFSLDPELDPYCIHKVIDQLAVRGGQPEHFMDLRNQSSLWDSDGFWGRCPNIAISTALVENRLKKPQECRASLQEAMQLYPWVFARLFQELNLDHIPKSIWGTTPRTPREKLDCESYVALAKDLWNTPEASSLLVEVASYAENTKSQTADNLPITLAEARHALLSDIPSIINCIPVSFTNQSTSSFDPFPPPENMPSYNANPGSGQYQSDVHGRMIMDDDDDEELMDLENPPLPPNTDQPGTEQAAGQGQDVRSLHSFFRRFIPWLGQAEAATGENDASAAPDPSNDMEAVIASSIRDAQEAGLSAAEIEDQGNRLLEALGNAIEDPASQETPEFREIQRQALEVQQQDLENDPLLQRLLATDPVTPPGQGGQPPSTLPSNNNLTPRATIEAATEQPSDLGTPSDEVASPYDLVPHWGQTDDPPTPPSPKNSGENTRGRHWLAGRGLLQLKAFTDRYGTDPAQWPDSTSEDTKESQEDQDDEEGEDGSPLLEAYISALIALPTVQDRKFILDFALPQGAGKDVAGMVAEALAVERRKRPSI